MASRATLELAVHGRSGDAEKLSDFGLRVVAGIVDRKQVFALGGGELVLWPRHALPGSHPDQVRFELSDHSEDIKQKAPDRVGGIIGAPTQAQRDTFGCEFISDVSRVRQRPGEPVHLCLDPPISSRSRT